MKTFKTSRVIPASPQAIFESFRDPAKLATWWGPAGFTNTFNRFQFEPGGRWSFIMHGPDGRDYPNENEFVEMVEPSQVVIRHLSEPRFVLTVNIKRSGSGSLVEWEQVLESDEIASHIAHIIEPANEQNLDRLTVVACAS
jgi:uncharacterized protein YndB with AHSA1/START domain